MALKISFLFFTIHVTLEKARGWGRIKRKMAIVHVTEQSPLVGVYYASALAQRKRRVILLVRR